VLIRSAEPADAAQIAAIYNEGIEERQATFETRPRSAAAFADPEPPFLVAEDHGRVTGWARATPWSMRECYSGVGEASIYVRRDLRGTGVGRHLLETLAAEAETAGYWKLIGALFPENEASRALMRAAGFREAGVFRRHSRLDGDWRDVVYVERLLGEAAER
jgi:L-amino acid N-acyltransferase YncA